MIVIYRNDELTIEQKAVIGKLYANDNVVIVNSLDKINELENVSRLIIVDSDTEEDWLQKHVQSLVKLFSSGIPDIRWLMGTGELLKRKRKEKESVLFVFPGSIVPLTMGSHIRAFNTLLNLRKMGYGIDVLIPGGKNNNQVKQGLEFIAENVYFYRNKKKRYPFAIRVKRYIEQKIRIYQGKSSNLPDLFSERNFYKPTESLKRWVVRLFLTKKYSYIYVNYAWMVDCVQYLDDISDEYKLICDTHDVQYYRNTNLLSRKERVFFNSEKEKKLELKNLRKADVTVAISPSDYDLLRTELNGKVSSCFPGFDYAMKPVRMRCKGRPIHFGFIGGGMEANVLAVKYILDHWWPIIQKHSPESIFYIAGSICNNSEINEYSFYSPNIELLGFVKSIDDYYKLIEVSLNPVIVSGGLNFKSVESVVAGKHLFTNKLGSVCLGNDFPCVIIDEVSSLISEMDKIEFNMQEDKRRRIENQNKALQKFGDKKFIEKMRGVLDGLQ